MDDDSGVDRQQQALALMQLQALVEAQKLSMSMLDTCFSRCVDTPGASLSTTQQQCIWYCTKRIFDTESFIDK